MRIDNPGAAEHDAEAVRRLADRLAEAWNHHDADGYAAIFTEDADYVAFDGTHLEGRTANAEHHRALFGTVLRGTRLAFENVRVRFVTPDVAVMHGTGSVLFPWHAEVPASRRSIQTYVVVRGEGEWRIAAFHNARVRPTPIPRGAGLKLLLLGFRARAALAGRPIRG